MLQNKGTVCTSGSSWFAFSFLTYFYTVPRLWPPPVNVIKLLQIEEQLKYLL